jgi:hypothetical protein
LRYLSRFASCALLFLLQLLHIFPAAAARCHPTPPPLGEGKYQQRIVKLGAHIGELGYGDVEWNWGQ